MLGSPKWVRGVRGKIDRKSPFQPAVQVTDSACDEGEKMYALASACDEGEKIYALRYSRRSLGD